MGVYGITAYINGMPLQVVIDDYIPVMDGKPYFSQANGPELWVILIEKAWASTFGSY